MPELLQTIADRDTSVLNEWATAFNEEVLQLDALPEPRRLRESVTVARTFNRHTSWAADTAEGWLSELNAYLTEGINGHELRVLSRSGRLMVRACLGITDLTRQLWQRAERFGASVEEVRSAEELVSAARRRMLAADARLERLQKVAEQGPPDVDPPGIEKGAEQIRQGKFLTPEQARDAVRKSG